MSYENRASLSEQVGARWAAGATSNTNIIKVLTEVKTELGITDEEFRKIFLQLGGMTDRETESRTRRTIGQL
ncbi:MAG: hypothetical protein WCT01_02680 [Candidatus Shapirobacteria bacterium]